MNGTHHELTYAEDVNIVGYDIRSIEINTDMLLNACTGLTIKTRKTKYMEVGRLQSTISNENITVGSNSYVK